MGNEALVTVRIKDKTVAGKARASSKALDTRRTEWAMIGGSNLHERQPLRNHLPRRMRQEAREDDTSVASAEIDFVVITALTVEVGHVHLPCEQEQGYGIGPGLGHPDRHLARRREHTVDPRMALEQVLRDLLRLGAVPVPVLCA